jgi:hypothetical protein
MNRYTVAVGEKPMDMFHRLEEFEQTEVLGYKKFRGFFTIFFESDFSLEFFTEKLHPHIVGKIHPNWEDTYEKFTKVRNKSTDGNTLCCSQTQNEDSSIWGT